jgi:hypothetical protein
MWLTVMTLFPCSLLLLKFNRGRLPRNPRTPLTVVFLSIVAAAAAFVGNIMIDVVAFGSALPKSTAVSVILKVAQLFCSIFCWNYIIIPDFTEQGISSTMGVLGIRPEPCLAHVAIIDGLGRTTDQAYDDFAPSTCLYPG